MDTVNRMTEFLEQEARQEAQNILAQAERAAQGSYKEGRMRAQKRRNEILNAYQREVRALLERAETEARREADHLSLAARQEMIDATLQAVQVQYNNRSAEEEMALLTRVYQRSIARAQGERPVVYVPEDRLAAARAALGQGVDVQRGGMKQGFLLSFEKYNVNFENDTLLRFLREPLEGMAAAYLFGGDGDENGQP